MATDRRTVSGRGAAGNRTFTEPGSGYFWCFAADDFGLVDRQRMERGVPRPGSEHGYGIRTAAGPGTRPTGFVSAIDCEPGADW
jgi:hypothetical protein